MQVLFVCNANVGRSQVAQVYFDQLSSHQSSSAGMAVDELMARQGLTSKKLKDVRNQRSQEYIQREFGVDLADRERQQLTPQLVDQADLVVVINERDQWPAYLQEGGKVVFWDIRDGVGQTEETVYRIYAEVRQKVEELVEELG